MLTPQPRLEKDKPRQLHQSYDENSAINHVVKVDVNQVEKPNSRG